MSNGIMYKGSKRMKMIKRAVFAAALGLATGVAFPATAQQGPNERRPLPGAPSPLAHGDPPPPPPHAARDRPDRDHQAGPDHRAPGDHPDPRDPRPDLRGPGG